MSAIYIQGENMRITCWRCGVQWFTRCDSYARSISRFAKMPKTCRDCKLYLKHKA